MFCFFNKRKHKSRKQKLIKINNRSSKMTSGKVLFCIKTTDIRNILYIISNEKRDLKKILDKFRCHDNIQGYK